MKVQIKDNYLIFPEKEVEKYDPLFDGDLPGLAKLEEINYIPEIVECNGIGKLKEILLNDKIWITEMSLRRILAVLIDELEKDKK
jgi:hypothetical protein